MRGNDPDGFEASFHPHEPYKVVPAKCRHRLVKKLVPMDFPQDEIYTGLEQTRPFTILMNTTISMGTFPQCTESFTRCGHPPSFPSGRLIKRQFLYQPPDLCRGICPA